MSRKRVFFLPLSLLPYQTILPFLQLRLIFSFAVRYPYSKSSVNERKETNIRFYGLQDILVFIFIFIFIFIFFTLSVLSLRLFIEKVHLLSLICVVSAAFHQKQVYYASGKLDT